MRATSISPAARGAKRGRLLSQAQPGRPCMAQQEAAGVGVGGPAQVPQGLPGCVRAPATPQTDISQSRAGSRWLTGKAGGGGGKETY